MALTADQVAMLNREDTVQKLAVEINASTPLRYCTGEKSVTIDSDLYSPRVIYGDSFALVSPSKSTTKIRIDDGDLVLRTAWYSDNFSGYACTIYLLARQLEERTFTEVTSLAWTIDVCSFKRNMFSIKLRSSYGHRQRFGLMVGNKSVFPRAPEVDEVFKFSGPDVYIPPPSSFVPDWMKEPDDEKTSYRDMGERVRQGGRQVDDDDEPRIPPRVSGGN
jgi:hypothetical protein